MPILSVLNWLDYYSDENSGNRVHPAASISFLQAANDETDQATTYTFSSQNLGSATPFRYIIVGIGGRGNGALRSISSVTIGGVTATAVATQTNGTARSSLYVAAVPTGTSGSVVVVWSGSMLRCGIGMWYALNINPTAEATGISTADPLTSDLVVSAESIQVAYAHDSQVATATWSGTNGPTEDFDSALGTPASQSGASRTSPTALTVTNTCTWTTSNIPTQVTASFAKA